MKIEALHNFHDTEYAAQWSGRFKPQGERGALFETILRLLKKSQPFPYHIMELGPGPGYLAEFVLRHLKEIRYTGVDFSEPFIKISSERICQFTQQKDFIHLDLTRHNWSKDIDRSPDAVITTWTLHDLFSKENILSVYQNVFHILAKGGTFLNGDFIKPEASPFEYEGGRIKPSEHLEMLEMVGFSSFELVALFDENVDQPTTANNYACFKAIK